MRIDIGAFRPIALVQGHPMPPELFRRSPTIVPSIHCRSLVSESDGFGLKTRVGLLLAISLCAASVIMAGTDKPTDVVRKSAVNPHASTPNETRAFSSGEAQVVALPDGAPICDNWALVAPMPNFNSNATATSDGIAAYVAGGYLTTIGFGTSPTNQFIRYDLAGNTWTQLTPMVDTNYLASAVYSPVNNKIYVFGGVSGSTVATSNRVYDMPTNTWRAGANMPAGRWAMASGYYNGKIYLVGGFSNLAFPSTEESQVWEYDVVADAWNTTRLAMPEAKGQAAFGIINGHIYVGGGRSGNLRLYDYDIATNTWTRRADLLSTNLGTASAVANGQLRIFGNSSNPGSGGQVYDPDFNMWSTGASFFPSSAAATAIGSTLFAAGGLTPGGMFGPETVKETRVSSCLGGCVTGSWRIKAPYPVAIEAPAVGTDGMFLYSATGLANGAPSSGFYRSNSRADAWAALPAVPAALYAGRGIYAASTNAFYILGGRSGSNALDTTYKYSLDTGIWTNGAPLPAPRYFSNVACDKVTGKIYVIGGFDATNNETNQTWEYDPVANTWSTARANIPTAMAGSGTSIVGQFIYLVGSWNGGAGSTNHKRYDIINDVWDDRAPPPVALYNPVAAAIGGRTFVTGAPPVAGGTSAGYRATYIYDVASNSWTIGLTTNVAHALAAGVAVNGRLLLVAGSNGSGTDTNTVESLAVVCSDCPNLFNEDFAIKPLRCTPRLVSAVSRKVHGGVGAFEIDLPLTGSPGIECRTGAVPGAHQIVLTFANSVAFSGVSVTAGTGNATASLNGTEVRVDLTGVANAQTITVTLANADDGANYGDVSVPMRVLAGDVNGNGSVNATDISQTKMQSGQSVTAANFQTDVNADGSINTTDVGLVKSQTGTSVP